MRHELFIYRFMVYPYTTPLTHTHTRIDMVYIYSPRPSHQLPARRRWSRCGKIVRAVDWIFKFNVQYHRNIMHTGCSAISIELCKKKIALLL